MLIGQVDSYLSSFDRQVSKMKAQLARSREHWMVRSRASSGENNLQVSVFEYLKGFD